MHSTVRSQQVGGKVLAMPVPFTPPPLANAVSARPCYCNCGGHASLSGSTGFPPLWTLGRVHYNTPTKNKIRPRETRGHR